MLTQSHRLLLHRGVQWGGSNPPLGVCSSDCHHLSLAYSLRFLRGQLSADRLLRMGRVPDRQLGSLVRPARENIRRSLKLLYPPPLR